MLWLTLRLLRSSKWQRRAKAAEKLGKYPDSRAVDALISATADPKCLVRAAAAESLGNLGDPSAVPALLRILATKSYDMNTARIMAACALGQILEYTSDDRNTIRMMAAEALGTIVDKSAVVDALAASLQDQYFAVQRVAAWALGQIGDARAMKSLLKIPLFAEKPTVQAMIKILTVEAAEIDEQDLRQLAVLDNQVDHNCKHSLDRIGNLKHELCTPEPVDCTLVRQLARQELARRGFSANGKPVGGDKDSLD